MGTCEWIRYRAKFDYLYIIYNSSVKPTRQFRTGTTSRAVAGMLNMAQTFKLQPKNRYSTNL